MPFYHSHSTRYLKPLPKHARRAATLGHFTLPPPRLRRVLVALRFPTSTLDAAVAFAQHRATVDGSTPLPLSTGFTGSAAGRQ